MHNQFATESCLGLQVSHIPRLLLGKHLQSDLGRGTRPRILYTLLKEDPLKFSRYSRDPLPRHALHAHSSPFARARLLSIALLCSWCIFEPCAALGRSLGHTIYIYTSVQPRRVVLPLHITRPHIFRIVVPMTYYVSILEQ